MRRSAPFSLVGVALGAFLAPVLLLPQDARAQAGRLLDDAERDRIVEAHNAARARFGAAPLVWDDTLARQALRCVGENRGRSFRHCQSGYGENMAGTTGVMAMAAAVQMWMDEEPLYEIPTQRCRDFACGHFTQVVWPTTERVGCAVGPGDAGWTNLICNYDPPGNYGFWGDADGSETDDGPFYYFDPPPFERGGSRPPGGGV